MKNEIVGEGTFGCVIKPALKCDKNSNVNNNIYKNTLSKVMLREDAFEELDEMKKISKIKNIEKFTIRKPVYCKPEIDENFIQTVKNCKTNRVKRQFQTSKSGLRQLIIDDGGVDVSKFYINILPNISNEDKNIFFTSILHLFKGLQFFSDNDIVHRDIKTLNIVYNIQTGNIRYIDFGMAISKSTFIKQSKENNNRHAQSWYYYPPEYSCANKSRFNAYSKCQNYKKDYGNDFDAFIHDNANCFDSYCLSLTLMQMIESLQIDKVLPKIHYDKFLTDFLNLMKLYSEKDIVIRSKDLNQLVNNYKNILKKHNIYSVKNPTPSKKNVEIAKNLSLEIIKRSKDKTNSPDVVRCPPSLPDFNPFTRKCVKPCKEGKIRNDKFRCVNKTKKIKKTTKKNNKSEFYKIFEKQEKIKECNDKNKDYNPITGRCNTKCKENQERDNQFKCKKKKQ